MKRGGSGAPTETGGGIQAAGGKGNLKADRTKRSWAVYDRLSIVSHLLEKRLFS